MELAEGGELFHYLIKNKRLTELISCHYFLQIINGIEYFHKQMIVHRDLKLENLLLDKYNNIKIVDFGLSNIYDKEEQLKTACGSPCYAAPEIISGSRYTGLKVDIWSCGIILYAMLCGCLPFEDNNPCGLYRKIISGQYIIPNNLSPEAKDLIKNILNVNPKKRFCISEIRNHNWFSINIPKGNNIVDVFLKDYTRVLIDYEIIKKMKKMGFDEKLIIKYLKENQFNSITTVYYLLLKQNYHINGKSSLINQEYNKETILNNFIDKIKKRAKSPIPIGDLSSIEAYQGLVKIVKTEGGQDTPHKHRKSNSLFIRRVPYNKKIETLPNDTDTNNKYVTKIDLRPKNHMDKPKIKIPYIKTFIQKGNFYYSNNNNMRNLKELVEANVQKLCFEGIFPQKYYLKSPTNIKTTNLLLKIKNRNKSAQK